MRRPLLYIFTYIIIYVSRVEGAEIKCSQENPCPLTGMNSYEKSVMINDYYFGAMVTKTTSNLVYNSFIYA